MTIAKLDDTGRPDIIDDIDGKNVTPSVVEFTSKTSIVGDGAKAKSAFQMKILFKRFSMGSNLMSFLVKNYTPTSIGA